VARRVTDSTGLLVEGYIRDQARYLCLCLTRFQECRNRLVCCRARCAGVFISACWIGWS